MSALIPNFTYLPQSRIQLWPVEAAEDSLSEDCNQLGEHRATKRFDVSPRIQTGRISESKDRFRDWLVSAWSTKPEIVRWANDVQRVQRASIPMERERRFVKLAHIFRGLKESRQILELKQDWDGEGSPGYTETVWNRACKFVMHNATEALKHHATVIKAPKILPGPNGSIDVHWKTSALELLVNIPSNLAEPAEFYGDDYGSLQIKGTLNPEDPPTALLLWLPTQN